MKGYTETRWFDLVLSKEQLPRTTTRQRWHEIDHWRRATRRKMAQIMDKQIMDLAMFGSTYPPKVREEIVDRMINPPIFAWPSS